MYLFLLLVRRLTKAPLPHVCTCGSLLVRRLVPTLRIIPDGALISIATDAHTKQLCMYTRITQNCQSYLCDNVTQALEIASWKYWDTCVCSWQPHTLNHLPGMWASNWEPVSFALPLQLHGQHATLLHVHWPIYIFALVVGIVCRSQHNM